jgi:hypothetical protein
MSLDYNLTKIENYKEVVWLADPTDDKPDQVRMNPVTETLIFGTMSVGLGAITADNVDEFVARFRIVEEIDGPFLRKDGKAWRLTDADFIAHIGLSTNVSNETRTAWSRRLFVAKQTSKTEQLARAFRYERERSAA